MNIRGFYWVLLIGLSLTLLFQWTAEKRQEAVNKHLSSAMSSGFSLGDDYASIENDDLLVVVSIPTGNIVETRLKKYPVENVQGSLGYRVFGESKESAFSYYFKSGFTNTSPVYSVSDFGKDSYFQKLSNQKCIPVFDIIGKINDKTYGHLVNNTGENNYTELLEVIKNEIK